MAMQQLYKLGDGLFYGRVYWVSGDMPSTSRHRNDVKSPPSSGWSHAFLIDKAVGRMVTLLCPYTLESFQVSRNCMEVGSMCMDLKYSPHPKNPQLSVEDGFIPWAEERGRKLLDTVLSTWAMAGRLSLSNVDFDIAAMVIRLLGGDVPLTTRPESAEPDKPRGGKAADDVLGLLRPVKRTSKRGQVLAFFLPEPRSVREAMAEFSTSRSNILSHLFMLQKEHGIGYSLAGDSATILLPLDCTDPWEPTA